MQNKKIAIFSGEIPSSTFIERLIEGLAINNEILLFGYLKNKPKYSSKSIKIIGYRTKIDKLLILIKYTILLTIFDRKNKQKLDKIIAKNKSNIDVLKTKFYPVLYNKPDIFHLQWAKAVAEWSWVQEFGIKYIVSLRGTHITISPYADEKLRQDYIKHFPKVDGFHAVSNDMKNEVLQYGINPEKIQVVYSGLDVSNFKFQVQPTPEASGHNLQPQILSIGRNHWVKGYNYALDACKILKNNNFDFNYKIIGIDEKAEELIFQKNDLQLNEQVHFINHLPFDEVKNEILNADILLLPSIEEGIANVVLEAMVLGTIVLTTNCGGMDEVVVDGENGFIVSIRNPKSIADKIIEISKLSFEELEKIRNNARNTIENQHNFEKMIHDMNELYQL